MEAERPSDAARVQAEALTAFEARVQTRVDEIAARLGRPLRVLHIGNIANNAYVNAKVMRGYGIEADVLVIDYYHVMGCPEWEEGVIEKLEGTQSDPDWGRTRVGGFRRPRWFIQGPTMLCAPYLRAKVAGRTLEARWRKALLDRNLMLRGAQGGLRKQIFESAHGGARLAKRLWFMRHGLIFRARLAAYYAWLYCYYAWLYYRHTKYYTRLFLHYGKRFAMLPVYLVRNPEKLWKLVPSALRPAAHSPVPAVSAATTADEPMATDLQTDLQMDGRSTGSKPEPNLVEAPPAVAPTPATGDLVGTLALDPLLAADIAAFQPVADAYREAFAYYDVVQGYAIDGIYPLLGGKADAYCCYEHGTLRDVPYQQDTTGRICAHAYKNAPAVFITNTDCVVSAARLGIGPERRFPIPHGFDSRRTLEFLRAHPDMKPHNDPVMFIAPARHHWKHGAYVSWLKGNDVPIRAARLLKDQGLYCKTVIVRWGQEVHESEKLIADLDVADYFEWIDPVPKERLWRYYLSCNGVLDQFVIPAIGGVSFETLAFGRPLFTYIDEPVFKDFFGEVPPLNNVHTPEQLAAAQARVIRDPHCYDEMGKRALAWTAAYHSSPRIVEVLLNGYERIMGRQERDGAPAQASQSGPVEPNNAGELAV